MRAGGAGAGRAAGEVADLDPEGAVVDGRGEEGVVVGVDQGVGEDLGGEEFGGGGLVLGEAGPQEGAQGAADLRHRAQVRVVQGAVEASARLPVRSRALAPARWGTGVRAVPRTPSHGAARRAAAPSALPAPRRVPRPHHDRSSSRGVPGGPVAAGCVRPPRRAGAAVEHAHGDACPSGTPARMVRRHGTCQAGSGVRAGGCCGGWSGPSGASCPRLRPAPSCWRRGRSRSPSRP